MYGIESLARLTEWFSKLPGIGPKSASRLAYYVIQMRPDDVKQFAQDMYRARLSVRECKICGNLTDKEICSICADDSKMCIRDRNICERLGTGAGNCRRND